MIYEIKIKITILYEEVLKKIVLTKFGRYTDYAYLQYQTSYDAKNMCTKFYQNISIITQITACMDGRTDNHSEFNSSRHRYHLYTYTHTYRG